MANKWAYKPIIESPTVQTNSTEPVKSTNTFAAYGNTDKALNPYYGAVSVTYYAQTGMPWLSADARKAVMTEWFWQPIRGQPRRVDTNEIRKYSNTVWVQSIIIAILNQVTYTPYVIIPKKEFRESPEPKDEVKKAESSEQSTVDTEGLDEEIKLVESFLAKPNKSNESFEDILRAWLLDVLEIDAGVIVKTYTLDSFDFEHLEPRSGAPILKPLFCPICNAKGQTDQKTIHDKAYKTLDHIIKTEKKLRKIEKECLEKKIEFKTKFELEPIKAKMTDLISSNNSFDENVMNYDRVNRQPGVTCPFCNGTGIGRRLTEIKAYDGASFLFDSDRTGFYYGAWQYSYSIPAHPMFFGKDEFIYFKQNNRSMSPYGYSAVQSSIDVIKALESSVQHNKTMFIDGAVPDGIVGVEDMSNEELTRMKGVWENDVKGQPHKVVFVNKRTTFSPFAFNNREMQFLEGQKEAWNQVIANFALTPADLGITRDLNRASASNMSEQSRKKCINPLMKKIENLVNSQLLPELGAQRVEFQFVLDDPQEERQQAEIAEILLRNDLKTVNEVREEMGLPPVEGGDKLKSEQQAEQMQNQMAMQSEYKMNEEGAKSHHKPGEIREQRDAGSESGKRERESNTNKPGASANKTYKTWNDFYKELWGLREQGKIDSEQFNKYWADAHELDTLGKDYQSAFNAQVPFITTIQNLSQGQPFALPKAGHPNTQSPYKELGALCPGCGSEAFNQIAADANSMAGDVIYRCQACNRTYGQKELDAAVATQEEMHNGMERDPLAPKVNEQVKEPLANLVSDPGIVATMMSPKQTQTGESIDTLPTRVDPFARGKKTTKKKVK